MPSPAEFADKEKINVKMVSWYDDHFYRIDYETQQGTVETDYIPSVTTKLQAIAKPFLINWYGDLGSREAKARVQESAERGDRIHAAWKTYCEGGQVIFHPEKYSPYTDEEIAELTKGSHYILRAQEEMAHLVRLDKFSQIINPEFLESEMSVYNLINRDAGTVDNFWRIKGGRYEGINSKPLDLMGGFYTLDVKSGNYVGEEAKMQVAAYSKCAEYMEITEKVDGALILHTGAKVKTGIEGLSVIHLTREDLDSYYRKYRHVAYIWEELFGTMKPKIFEFPSLIKRPDPMDANKGDQKDEAKPKEPENDTRRDAGVGAKEQKVHKAEGRGKSEGKAD